MQCAAKSYKVYLENANLNVHVVEAGNPSNKMVLFIHGFPDCWHSWSRIMPAFVKEGYFVVAPDLVGYGLSDKPTNVSDYRMDKLQSYLEELISHYHKESILIVAHDWGGIIAWHLAANRPELIEKMVIMNAPYPRAYAREAKNWDQFLNTWYFYYFQIPFIPESFMSFNMTKTVNAVFKTRNIAVNEADQEILSSSMAQPGAAKAMVDYYRALLREVIFGKTFIGKVEVPVLILWGESDVALVRGCADCVKWVPRVQVQYIPKVSHWVQYEVPEIVKKQALKFFA